MIKLHDSTLALRLLPDQWLDPVATGLLNFMFWVYIIRNERGKIYVGQTQDLAERLKRHNGKLASKKRSYTKINGGLWRVVYQEEYSTRGEVVKKKYLKSHSGRDWLRNKLAR